ncbi:hypothetical protein AVEN_208469-1 [Araneus ventricosus]|uniref:Uncharacterized protein n=1 Tax=Araneus ventricosus TaxID=182803 RepID=A0A4Y2P6V7_ARAVE|nr:hypothetical protein AVEN_208469-1 [Araneus ventricosus]
MAHKTLQPDLSVKKVTCLQMVKQIPTEDDSIAIYLDAEVTEYSYQETDSESDMEENPVHEECRESNSNINSRIIHPFVL